MCHALDLEGAREEVLGVIEGIANTALSGLVNGGSGTTVGVPRTSTNTGVGP